MAQGGQLGAQCTRGQDLRAGRGGRAEEWRKAGSRGRAPQRPYSLKRALHAGATKREERASRAYRQDSQYGNQFTLCVGLESRTQYIMCVGGSTVSVVEGPRGAPPPFLPLSPAGNAANPWAAPSVRCPAGCRSSSRGSVARSRCERRARTHTWGGRPEG